jgi:hypothetical protein
MDNASTRHTDATVSHIVVMAQTNLIANMNTHVTSFVVKRARNAFTNHGYVTELSTAALMMIPTKRKFASTNTAT